MAKDRIIPEASAHGVRRRQDQSRHLFVCVRSRLQPTPEQGDETWDLRQAADEGAQHRRARWAGLPHARCKCLRICTGGPIAVVYPEGTWYRNVTPENAERIIQEHVIGGRIVEDLCFARNPVVCVRDLGTR